VRVVFLGGPQPSGSHQVMSVQGVCVCISALSGIYYSGPS